jgi:hypothetical protein
MINRHGINYTMEPLPKSYDKTCITWAVIYDDVTNGHIRRICGSKAKALAFMRKLTKADVCTRYLYPFVSWCVKKEILVRPGTYKNIDPENILMDG